MKKEKRKFNIYIFSSLAIVINIITLFLLKLPLKSIIGSILPYLIIMIIAGIYNHFEARKNAKS